jgi:hypothetical protein
MVFDKAGRFVEGLKPTDFELRVDGRPQSIEFFELVRAGSHDEDAQLRAARGGGGVGGGGGRAVPLDRGRTIFFFVDDLHLAPQNIPRVRATLKRFIDAEMARTTRRRSPRPAGRSAFYSNSRTIRPCCAPPSSASIPPRCRTTTTSTRS